MKNAADMPVGVDVQGNLISPDLTPEILAGEVKGQAPEDFGLSKSDKLADEIALAWGDAKAYWAAFQRAVSRLPEDDPATTVTREQWVMPLLRSLGYEPVYTAKAEVVEGQTYAISHRAEPGENKPPIHIIGSRVRLEQRPPSGIPRLSAHALVQEYLNRTEHLWAVVTNGLRWRLLRDSSLMTRLTYVEFDLEQILNGENFAEFGLFYRLFHRSRLPEGMDDADECLLEFYHQESLQQGGRVRDRLRDGVESALKILGTGFLQHPQSQALREKLLPSSPSPNSGGEKGNRSENSLPSPSGRGAGGEGNLTPETYYRQLLMLIYRLLFLMVAESRNLLLSNDDPEKIRIYREYYSIERLRALVERQTWRREGFQDLWQGLRVTFQLFDENWRGQVLGLSPLDGDLFGSNTLSDLDGCAIDNHDLILALRQLSLYEQKSQLRRVNYGALDVEELGSVYESLLEFHPQVKVGSRESVGGLNEWHFELVVGSERKTTGSYYTPPELVGQLIKSALEPVIEAKLQSVSLTPQPPLPEGEGEEEMTLTLRLPGGEGEQEESSQNPSPLGRGAGVRASSKWEIPVKVRQKMQEVARQFRKQPTPSEAILWEALRNRQLENRKFRRQHPIGTFVVDFFCQEENLIVEVDGLIHQSQQELDRQRQELLESLGLRFVRVSSQQVETALSDVLETIKQSFQPPSPFGRGAGGEGESRMPSSPNPNSGGEKGNQSENQLPSPSGRGAGGEGIQQLQEQALLSLKVCDPACGSGHFLLAAARRIGKELARIRTGEAQPGTEPLRQAIRDVIQHCIYGVDLNPLAVDLCKVALWLEGLCRGLSLNFLDHRIKCGNSLVGVLDLDCLNEGIPDNAFKPVTGDDKKLASLFKKRNKQERESAAEGQLTLQLDPMWEQEREEYAKAWREIEGMKDDNPAAVRQKQAQYERSRQISSWLRDKSACNLWTAAFFMPLTEHNLQLLPTSAMVENLLRGNRAIQAVVEAADQLAEEKRFFHWCLEFPEVFGGMPSSPNPFSPREKGNRSENQLPSPFGRGAGGEGRWGFDCVLGNPPWERIKLQEKEFFAARDSEIANAKNKAARGKLIRKLPTTNPALATEWEVAQHDANAQSKFIRESDRFPLTATGDINTYAVFAETVHKVISTDGRAGIIVPVGIATDNTTKDYFGYL